MDAQVSRITVLICYVSNIRATIGNHKLPRDDARVVHRIITGAEKAKIMKISVNRTRFERRMPAPYCSRWVSAVLLVLASVLTNSAYAHKVNLFAYTEGDKVYVQGYFADGKMAQSSEVSVYGPQGERLLQGVTNDAGEYTFSIPKKVDLRIVLNAGMGHQAESTFSADELSGTGVGARTASHNPKGGAVHESDPAPVSPPADNAELRELVHKAVLEGTKPLAREIAEMRQHALVSEIVGGVGYIVGILGILAYMQARKGRKKGDQ